MILVDANVFMYAAGSEHPHKSPAVGFLAQVANGQQEAAVDAETLQEILHRYRSIGRFGEGRRLYLRVRELFEEVLPITAEVMDRTHSILGAYPEISARDAVHAAVVAVYRLDGICSYDRHFDRIPGCVRREPEQTKPPAPPSPPA